MRLCSTVLVVTDTSVGAVVKRNELHARRQRPVAVDLVDLGLDARHHVVGVQRPVHDHDRRDHIVFVVAAGLAEPRHIADIDLGDVLDRHRHAVRLRQHDFLDVADLVALGQIGSRRRLFKRPMPRMLTDCWPKLMVRPPTLILALPIALITCGKRDVVGVELVQIDLDLEFLGGAAPGVDLHDARDGQKPALQDPILDGAQIGQPEMRRPDDLIAIDFADQARALDLRRDVVRQADVLLQADRGLRERKIIIDSIVERDADE